MQSPAAKSGGFHELEALATDLSPSPTLPARQNRLYGSIRVAVPIGDGNFFSYAGSSPCRHIARVEKTVRSISEEPKECPTISPILAMWNPI
jgi:hypothetical protein